VTTTPRIANADDAETVTKLLKAFFSHEGRVVRHLQQNVEAILCDPGRGFFMVADEAAVATTTIRISASGGAYLGLELDDYGGRRRPARRGPVSRSGRRSA